MYSPVLLVRLLVISRAHDAAMQSARSDLTAISMVSAIIVCLEGFAGR